MIHIESGLKPDELTKLSGRVVLNDHCFFRPFDVGDRVRMQRIDLLEVEKGNIPCSQSSKGLTHGMIG